MQNSKLQFKIQNFKKTLHFALCTLHSCQRQVGFTLIELLVIISIIGIISAVSLSNVAGFTAKGRDAKRKQDLKQIQIGLEMYRQDKGSYPTALPECGKPLLIPTPTPLPQGHFRYLKETPCDPKTRNSYGYSSGGSAYTLYACIENVGDTDKNIESVGTSTCTSGKKYVLANPK